LGVEGAKYVSPHPREPILLDITILGTRTDFDCISLRNRSRESVCMVAPHSEQTSTCKRASFQYKAIHIPQGDSFRTTAPQDGPGDTYKNDSKPNNTFLNNIFLIKITTLAASPFSVRSAAGGWSGPSPGRPLHPSRASLPPATQPPRPTPRCWPPAASSSAPRAVTPVATAPRT
jgi:hypothetical protein